MKSLKMIGSYKNKISSTLFKNDDIQKLLIGKDYDLLEKKELYKLMGKHILSHEFIDNIIEQAETNIYYDITISAISSTVNSCKLYLYCICDRKILDSIKTYEYKNEIIFGNKADILSCVVNDILMSIEDIGVGGFEFLDSNIINTKECYGRVLVYKVPDFR